MEHIGRTAFLKTGGHVPESGEEEGVELLVLNRIVLNGQPAGALEGNAVGRVGHDQVGLDAVHERVHRIGRGTVPTHHTMLAQRPDVAGLYI